MPISEKKIEANRRNAQKSTGPKTESGKAASCANALKHGLYSTNIVIRSSDLSENPAEYELLIASLREVAIILGRVRFKPAIFGFTF